MVDYVFPQDYITQKGSHGKYPVKTCCMSDDLSGDMLVPIWPTLVIYNFFLLNTLPLFTDLDTNIETISGQSCLVSIDTSN